MKKKTRRSISIRGETYNLVQSYCQDHGVSVSAYIEALLAPLFDLPTTQKRTPELPQPTTKGPQGRDPDPVAEEPPHSQPPSKPPRRLRMRPTKDDFVERPILALPPPRSEVRMPLQEGPLTGYVCPLQSW